MLLKHSGQFESFPPSDSYCRGKESSILIHISKENTLKNWKDGA